ncbi:MAG TPA: peptide MFS transporter [Gemmatimonadaceae bacterium]|nr:peptide MFS transporter [Gemmatimonadaceae bacterium]
MTDTRTVADSEAQSHTRPQGTGILGHPRGLVYLCASEGWERFSYFGMQSLLVLYLTHYLLQPEHVGKAVGFAVVRRAIEAVTGPLSTAALASQVFGLYAGLVYLTPLLGGLVADRWLNRTLTVTVGAMLMAAGHFLMAFEATFLLAIALLLVGVGCFKGNIASQVGQLYAADDPRRAQAYQIFQLAIALAVIAAPLISGTLGEKVGWHWGFGAAGVGMLVGLATYLAGRKWLPSAGPSDRANAENARRLTRSERRTVLALVALLPVLGATQVGNQQMFNAFLVWGEANFELQLAGFAMPVTWLLSADAAIAVVCMALAIIFWQAYGRRWKEPDDVVKVAVGAVFMTLAPLLLTAASVAQQATGGKISPGWGLAFEVVNELGFALVAPMALSLYSRAAPRQLQGLMIGVYYTSLFMCNVAVGRLGGLLEQMDAAAFWLMHAGIVGASAAVLAVVAVWGRRVLMPVQA